MSEQDFQSLLERPMDSFTKPKPLPEGSYIFGVSDYKLEKATTGSDGKTKSAYIEFTLIPKQPNADVDADALSEMLDGNDITTKQVKKKFYITPDAMYRLTEFMSHCGLDVTGKPTSELLPATKGCEVLGNLKHNISQRDPSMTYVELAQTAPVEQV
jgi:hypothetical protein